jgi:hypothetical protein
MKRMNPFAQKSVLVRNDSQTLSAQFQKLTINFTPGAKTRTEMLEGRPHTVVPMVMLLEGVHAGSSGPILYPWDEISKTPQIWNQKPIVVYHPEASACDPDVVNNRKVGVIMNAKADAKSKRIPAEAWLEQPRADLIDKRIFEAILKNEMMEVSTGLYADLEQSPGEWNGEEYQGVARNVRADHLALLPDKIGACSIADGAGLLRNELKRGKMDEKGLLKRIGNLLGLTHNEMSFENIRSSLQSALRTKLNVGDAGPWTWIESVYANFFVYEMDGKLFRLDYSSTDAGVSLSDEAPVPVVRVTEYRTVEGAKFVGNQDQPKPTEENMNKTQMIAAILAANCGWSEAKALEGLSDKQIESIHGGIKATTPSPAGTTTTTNQQPAPAKETTIVATPSPAPVGNAAPLTTDAWLAQAPPEVASVVRGMLSANQTEESGLIEKIAKNESMGFKAEDLKGMPIGNLRKLAKLSEAPAQAPQYAQFPIAQPAPNFSGMAPAAPVSNEGPVAIAPLATPVWNFRKEKGQPATA